MRRPLGSPTFWFALTAVAFVALLRTSQNPNADRVRVSTSPEGDLLASVHRRGGGFAVLLATPDGAPVEVATAEREPRMRWGVPRRLVLVGAGVRVRVAKQTFRNSFEHAVAATVEGRDGPGADGG